MQNPELYELFLLPQYFLEIHIDSLENQAYDNMLVTSGEEKGDGDFTASNKTDQDSGSRSSSNRQQEHI